MSADADIQLSDLLESYPSVTTPGFQTLITAKKEFSEMAAQVGEKLPPGKGQYYKHQKFFHRFFRSYDELLDMSTFGSGKSCSWIGFIEYTIKERMKKKTDPTKIDEKVSHFDKYIILVKNNTQKNELRNQILCKCSDGHYLTELIENSKETVQARNISLELRKAGYKIDTYRKFASRIAKTYKTPEDDEKLAVDFANTFFWIDEAHNLFSDPGKTGDKTEKSRVYRQIHRVLHLALRRKVVISTATPAINDEAEIGTLMNLILPEDGVLPKNYDYSNISDNDFRTFFPGYQYNPRITTRDTWLNYFRQLYPLDYNLQNPNIDLDPYIRNDLGIHFKGQIPKDFDFKTATLQDLEPYFRGRIGYIRSTTTGAVPVDEGQLLAEEMVIDGKRFISNLVAEVSWMSDEQTRGYLASKITSSGRDDLYGGQRQASNFVFPDGYWGNGITDEERNLRKAQKKARSNEMKIRKKEAPIEINADGGFLKNPIDTEANELSELYFANNNNIELRGFRRYVEIVDEDTYRATPEFIRYINNIDNIGVYSCKYKNIIEHVAYEPGNCFVYGEYVRGSGAVVLGLCLEQMGFTRYNENSSIFIGSGGDDTATRKLCASDEKIKVERKSRLTKGVMRYALLTGEITDAKFVSLMETMNSYENRHGELIKVLISSKSGRDGINVNNVLQVHLVGPEWNQSSMQQALARGIRATSHDELIKEEEKRIESEGGDPSTARIEIKVYRHAAISGDQPPSSIDLQMYRVSEWKDRGIKRIMHIMKQCAIGCQVNRKRNIRQPPDIDYSPECDYELCNYQCADPSPPPGYVDYSTYDVVYADGEINDAMDAIITIFKTDNAFTMEDITKSLPNNRRKYIIMSLEKIIINKIPLIDKFGYTAYLREDNGTFYLDRNYPSGTEPSYAMSYYTKGIIAIQKETLTNVVITLESGEYEEIFRQLEGLEPDDPAFDELLSSISIEGQALILEEVIKREMLGQVSKLTTGVIQKYKRLIFRINDPISELEKLYKELSDNKPKRGRKRNPEIKRRMKKINASKLNFVQDQNTEEVVIHTLYSQVTNQTRYAVTARFNKGEGRTRIIKPSEFQNGWRDINQTELPVYNQLIQNEIAKDNKSFEEKGIYGFILPGDDQFHISDKTTEDPGAADDNRKRKRGKVCKNWLKPDLIDVMWKIGISSPEGNFPELEDATREFLVTTLYTNSINKTPEELSQFSTDQLIWYYKWYYTQKKITKDILCDIIKNKMKEDGRLRE